MALSMFVKTDSSRQVLLQRKTIKLLGMQRVLHGPSQTSSYVFRQIPLNIASIGTDGKLKFDPILMTEKEQTITVNTTKPFKLNYDTTGVCKFLTHFSLEQS